MADLVKIDPYSPNSLATAQEMATTLAKSRLFGISSPEAAFAIMATGHELGLSPLQSLRGIHIIDGKPSPSADMLVAVVLRSGLAEYFREVSTTDKASTWETKRRGDAKAKSLTYSLDEAKQAGLTGKQNWSRHPKRMLAARAKSFLARDVYPDLLFGLVSQEELLDATPIAAEPEPTFEVTVEPEPAPAPTFEQRLAACASRAEVVALGEEIKPARDSAERAALLARIKEMP